MKRRWKGMLGAVGAFILVYIARGHFGMAASLVIAAALVVGWGAVYLYAESRLDRLYEQFERLDREGKEQALEQLDPEIRKDIEKRIAKAKK
jgi:hypothetical protein